MRQTVQIIMSTLVINVFKKINFSYRLCSRIQSFHSSSSLCRIDKEMDITLSTETNDKVMPVFLGKTDRFGGVTVVSKEEPCSSLEFLPKLEESLKLWLQTSKRTVWFKVDLEHSEWVSVLVKKGFIYHHAHKDFVMMYKWLPTDPCNVPPYAHTMIGVGALVVNDDNKVLVVKEKNFLTPNWKLPGGYVEPGEDFVSAAIREVKEETNITAEYVSLIALRHAHKALFGYSDLYIVVHLRPLTTEITRQDQEIAESKWMDIPEYLTHPNVHELNRLFVEKYLFYKKNDIKIECTPGVHQILKKAYNVFHVTQKL